MAHAKERRRFARVEVAWPATIITSKPQSLGEMKNISQVGASMYCQELPPIGQEFRLEIQPPDRQPIVVSARPIWALETEPLEVPHRFVLGVEFEYISADDAHFLGDVIAEQVHEND